MDFLIVKSSLDKNEKSQKVSKIQKKTKNCKKKNVFVFPGPGYSTPKEEGDLLRLHHGAPLGVRGGGREMSRGVGGADEGVEVHLPRSVEWAATRTQRGVRPLSFPPSSQLF